MTAMNTFSNLFLARQLAQSRRDDAANQLAQVCREQDFAREQMVQLQGYAGETDARWQSSAQLGTAPELLRHHYQFMERLTQAIGLQQNTLARIQERVDAARQAQVQADVYLNGLDVLIKKRQAQVAVQLRRQDQKQMDEFAAMQTQRKAALWQPEDLS
jgi:flagellar FliJ protein